MQICDILSADRIFVDERGSVVQSKRDALRMLSEMLAPNLETDRETVERLLLEREELQSTGIGDGVAIPHTSLEAVPKRVAALLLCPSGIPFEAIDGQSVRIILGVVGPKEATGEHLRVLARVSRLLRNPATRDALAASSAAADAYRLIQSRERELQ